MEYLRGWKLAILLLIASLLIAQCHKKAESEEHEEDGGEKYGEDNYDEEGHKAEKGHKGGEEYEKGEKGSYGKSEESHHFDEVLSLIK